MVHTAERCPAGRGFNPFRSENPSEWNLVGGNTPAKRSASGAAQLPLDGIAALETTRKHGTRLYHPLPLAHVPPTTC